MMIDGTAEPGAGAAFHVTDRDIASWPAPFGHRARAVSIPQGREPVVLQPTWVGGPVITLPGLPTTTDPTPVITQMVRRASSPGFETWWRRVESVGCCAYPIQLVGAGSIGRRAGGGRAATTAEPPSARRARICTPVTPGSWCTPVPPVGHHNMPADSRCSPTGVRHLDRAQLRHGAQRHRRALPPPHRRVQEVVVFIGSHCGATQLIPWAIR